MGVKMRYPGIDKLGEAESEAQFRMVWAPRGWELVPPEVVLGAEHFGRSVASLDELTRAELIELAAVNQIDVKAAGTKQEIAKEITDSAAAAAVAPAESVVETEHTPEA